MKLQIAADPSVQSPDDSALVGNGRQCLSAAAVQHRGSCRCFQQHIISHLKTHSHPPPMLRPGGGPLQVGSRTECALLALAAGLGDDYAAARERHRQAAVAPFSSERKRMSTLAMPAVPRLGLRAEHSTTCLFLEKFESNHRH